VISPELREVDIRSAEYAATCLRMRL